MKKKCRGVLLSQKNRAGINYRNIPTMCRDASQVEWVIYSHFLSVLLNCMECIKSSGYDGYLQALIKPQRLSRRVSETGIWEHFRTSFQSIQIAANNFLVLCDVLSLPAACGPTSTLSSQSYKCWKKSPEYMLRAYFKTQWFAVTVENILAVCYCVIEHVVCQWNVMHGSRPVDVRLKQ